MTEQDMKDRAKRSALEMVKLCERLSTSVAGRTIADQLVRSGTSIATTYIGIKNRE